MTTGRGGFPNPPDGGPNGDVQCLIMHLIHGKPIVADDETIRAALEDANIPALMVSLVHLTGEMDIVRGEIRPRARNLADPQAGVKEEQQAVVREIAFEALKAYRDRGCTLPPAPSRARVWEMMNFMIGEEIPEDYGAFLEGELSLNGEDPFVPSGMDDLPGDKRGVIFAF